MKYLMYLSFAHYFIRSSPLNVHGVTSLKCIQYLACLAVEYSFFQVLKNSENGGMLRKVYMYIKMNSVYECALHLQPPWRWKILSGENFSTFTP